MARSALARDAADAEAQRLLGYSLLYQGRFAEARAPLEAALAAGARRGVAYRLGHCCLALGDFAGAERALREELAAHPDMAEAHNTLGVALANQSRHEAALAAFRAAAALAPESAEANNNLANALSELERHEEALPYLHNVVRSHPRLAEAHYNLATVLQTLKRHEEAIGALQSALRLAPRMSYALGYLVWNALAVCRWDTLEEDVAALRAQVREEGIAAEPFGFLAVSPSPAEQLACARAHARERFLAATAGPRPARAKPRPLRLAYLSADYREHATGYVMAGLFEQHERASFEVLGISYGADDGSPMRRRLERAFDRFVDVRGRSDEQVARLLAELEVDIAVDLKGYTTGGRPGILASRPAPVQVSYMGFPATMGVDFIDYLIADRCVIPPQERACYAEKIVYMPACYWVNDATRRIGAPPAGRAAAGLPERGFVFCCFNHNYKITPPVFAVWMRLLREVAGSVLWLLEDTAAARRGLERAAREAAIDPSRLVFAPRAAHAEHLARHRLADLFLDTLPYNAHTTASDALWAGLPVLTCPGSAFVGRVAASMLHATGLPELVTRDADEYERLAAALAREPQRLAALRAKLDANRLTTPFFDTALFARGMESAYRTMWELCRRGEAPRSFAVGEAP
ncbi:MAG: O-linked N-acetylglucosamine transferase, SPINDLY family protein [Betaproteobacteria bacterium]